MLVITVQSCFLQNLHRTNFSVLGIFALWINNWSCRTMFNDNAGLKTLGILSIGSFQDFLICFLLWRHQYPFDPKIQLEIANAFAKQCKPIYVNLSNYNFECWMTVLLAASWGDDYGIKVILICNVQAAEFTQCHSSSSSLELCHHQSNITSSNSFVAYSDHVQWPARTCKVYMSSDFEGRSHTQSHKLSSPVMCHFAHTRHLPLLYISNIHEAMSLLKCQTSFESNSDLHSVSQFTCVVFITWIFKYSKPFSLMWFQITLHS